MRYTRSLVLLALVAGLLALALPGYAGPAPYVLKQTPLTKSNGKPDPTGPVKMTLIKAGQTKPVWTYTGADPQEITWSSNGRALALWFQPHQSADPPEEMDILVWREGHPVATYHSDEFNVLDHLWGFQFSPDNTAVVFRGGGGGGYLIDGGSLYLYDLVKNKMILGPDEDVRKVVWMDSKTIQYWPLTGHFSISKEGVPAANWDVDPPKIWHISR